MEDTTSTAAICVVRANRGDSCLKSEVWLQQSQQACKLLHKYVCRTGRFRRIYYQFKTHNNAGITQETPIHPRTVLLLPWHTLCHFNLYSYSRTSNLYKATRIKWGHMGQEGYTHRLTQVGPNNSLFLNDSTVTSDAHRERTCKLIPSLFYQPGCLACSLIPLNRRPQNVVAAEKWPSCTFRVGGKHIMYGGRTQYGQNRSLSDAVMSPSRCCCCCCTTKSSHPGSEECSSYKSRARGQVVRQHLRYDNSSKAAHVIEHM